MTRNMGSISERVHIAWLPDEPSEPTWTIVLTSPQRRFVDLRILRDGLKSEHDSGELTLARLDWGLAGVSSTSVQDDGHGNSFSHSKWSHWVDSRTEKTEAAADEGDVFANPDGTALEKGIMVNPATGRETAYEELWSDTEPMAIPQYAVACVVLQFEGTGSERGVIIRLGEHCQGLLRSTEGVTAERWLWKPEDGWTRTHKLGRGEMPCSKLLEKDVKLGQGDELVSAERLWTVVEVHEEK